MKAKTLAPVELIGAAVALIGVLLMVVLFTQPNALMQILFVKTLIHTFQSDFSTLAIVTVGGLCMFLFGHE